MRGAIAPQPFLNHSFFAGAIASDINRILLNSLCVRQSSVVNYHIKSQTPKINSLILPWFQRIFLG